ncbi:MAG: CoA pyrophosphatase [Ignavibacteriaceae bacterium]|jgi:8-oxo-dGTP pyrophosphatase MutT (NUDIX family)
MNKSDLDKLKIKLPSVPGVLGKEEYFNAAVLIPLVLINGEYNFLFEKRAAQIRQGGEICFPGGEFDSTVDSSFMDTAVRETIEELAIRKEDISIHGILDTLIGPMGVTVDSFIGTLDIASAETLQYDRNEVEKIFTIPVSFFRNNKPEIYHTRIEINPTDIDKNGEKVNTLPAKELQLPERYSKTWRGRKHNVYVYKTIEGVIWGITAALINEFIHKLKS